MPKRLTAAEVHALAEPIRSTLALVDVEQLSASTATTYRLQGALAALDAVRGAAAGDLLGCLRAGEVVR